MVHADTCMSDAHGSLLQHGPMQDTLARDNCTDVNFKHIVFSNFQRAAPLRTACWTSCWFFYGQIWILNSLKVCYGYHSNQPINDGCQCSSQVIPNYRCGQIGFWMWLRRYEYVQIYFAELMVLQLRNEFRIKFQSCNQQRLHQSKWFNHTHARLNIRNK